MRFRLRVGVVATAALASSCHGPADDAPPPGCSADAWETWTNFAEPLVQTWCTPCHSVNVAGDDRRGAPEGINFDTYDDVVAHADRISARIAVDAPAQMPPAGGLTDDERQSMVEWIDCGEPGGVPPIAPVCSDPEEFTGDAVVDGVVPACPALGKVTGNLTITAGSVDLSCLCAVDGDLTVTAGSGDVSLPTLTSVGGAFTASGAGASSISAPAVVSIGGALTVSGMTSLGLLDLTGVTSVGGSLSVSNNPVLATALLDRVSTVGGDFAITGNPALSVWRGQQSPRSIAGNILVTGNNALPSLDGFGRLAIVSGDVTLSDNAALTSITGFETATEVHGTFTVSDNAGLTFLQPVPDALTLTEGLVITGNPVLTEIDGPLLVQTIGAGVPGAPGIVIDGNSALTILGDFPALTAVAAVDVSFDGELARLDILPALESVDGDITFDSDGSAVGLLGLFALTDVGGTISVKRSTKLNNISAFDALTAVPSLFVSNVDALSAAPGLAALATVDGDLTLATTGLSDLDDLAGLREVHGNFVLAGNGELTDLAGLYGVTGVDGTLTIQSNPVLPQAEIDALISAIGLENIGAVVVSDNGP